MISIDSIPDIGLLRESIDLECKLAAGRDGNGALPEDFWPTYSAFANTEGGVVLLGVKEKQRQFSVFGVNDVEKVRKELFDALNNRQKVSVNLLTDSDVCEVKLEGKNVIVIEIPRAKRTQRPVYLTTNPFVGHTFRRLNDGDRPLPDDEVKRMLAEQVEDSRDDRILPGYDMRDIQVSTFRAYRQIFFNRDPGHPWSALEDEELLRQLGGWRKSRESGEAGLTLAGLLMFGQFTAIQEVLPHYMLDYQERPEAKTDNRWVDRVTLDGKWSGNLFDFYRKVYLKLTAELKVPFQLEKGERKEETPVHEALREALANVLVHADYSDRASVLVVKRPDMFGFRNPGLMRIPVEVAIQGGEADCRNRTLHKMFRLVGVGEQAGTGIPRILHGWRTQHWNLPKLYDTSVPYNQTLLELRMVDLFPENIMAALRTRFGLAFERLDHLSRVALAVAASEGTVNHARLRAITTEHPVELSKTFQHLTQAGMLASTGGRGAVYHLPGQEIPTPEDVFGPTPRFSLPDTEKLQNSAPLFDTSSSNLSASSSNLNASSSNLMEPRTSDGCLITSQLSKPVIDDLSKLSATLRSTLEGMAAAPRMKAKVDRAELIQTVTNLCHGRFITLSCLAELVQRKPDTLRNQYLTPMVRDRTLELAFPKTPTHQRQAYSTPS
jgi:predicted HTH transcriptional regulator